MKTPSHSATQTPAPFEMYEIERLTVYNSPFGLDPQGREISDISGQSIRGSMQYMVEVVRRTAAQHVPPHLEPEERARYIGQAGQTAVEHLVAMLNASFRDPRFHVTADYLWDASNSYSYEFSLIVNQYAKAICGDPTFNFNRGVRSVPRRMAWILRPLSVQQVYEILPRLTAKYARTDMRVSKVVGEQAVVQWWPTRELAHLPKRYQEAYLRMGDEVWQGVFAAVPQVAASLPVASVQKLQDRLAGDPCFEWAFTWESEDHPRDLLPWLGAAGSSVLLILSLIPGWLPVTLQKLGMVLAPLPFLVSWYGVRLQRARKAESRRTVQLLEQRQASDQQHDRLLGAYRDIQVACIDMERTVDRLTILHEIGLAIASTFDLDALLGQVLELVTSQLYFDRALIMLVDEERHILTIARSLGGTPEMEEVVEDLQIPLHADGWAPARSILSGEPILVSHDTVAPDAAYLFDALKTRLVLFVPLLGTGRPVGVLAVDNAISELPITKDDQQVLLTLGRSVAVAIENVRLYESIEEHNRTLERRVAARTSQLSEALKIAKLAHWEYDVVRQQFVFNDQFYRIYRTSPEAVGGYTLSVDDYVRQLVHPDDTDIIIDAIAASVEPQDPEYYGQVEYRALWPDGEVGYMLARWRLNKDASGRTIKVLGTVQDITERKEAEQALREFQRQLEASYAEAQERARRLALLNRISMVANSSLDLSVVLQAACETLVTHFAPADHCGVVFFDPGQTQGEVVAEFPDLGVQGTTLPTADYLACRRVIETGEAVAIADAQHDPQMTPAWDVMRDLGVQSTLILPLIVHGNVIGTVELDTLDAPHTFTSAEIELAQTIAAQLSMAVANARLYNEAERARQIAEIASQAKSAFLANVSHELRTPLTSVLGFAKIVKKRLQDVIFPVILSHPHPEVRGMERFINQIQDNLDIIVEEGDHLTYLINDVLDLSKIESGRIEWDIQPVQIEDVIAQAASTVQPAFQRKPVTLQIEMEGEFPPVQGDFRRLVQVVENLLSNAVKFTQEGSVTCHARRVDDKILVSVADTGTGIDPSNYERVFDSFVQVKDVDDVFTDKPQGTGLGLPISKNIVEYHGGEIWLESEVGEGSTFFFTLPVLREDA
jgi:PAS domain S-box-containing protein